MSNHWTISGTRILISQSEYDWERAGLNVNEGLVALQHNGKTFIIYSASYYATADYKLRMLTYAGGDPLRKSAWIKYSAPVFQRSDANGVFAPGHNGFFELPDGKEDWIVYHANNGVSDGCVGLRSTRAQKFTWNADGTPNFGIPVSTSEVIAVPSGDIGTDPIPDCAQMTVFRFKAYVGTDYIRHKESYGSLDVAVEPRADSQFIVVPGLGDPTGISIISANFPGHYLRHHSNSLVFEANDGSNEFKGDATWLRRPGFADPAWLSLESQDQPGSFIGRKFGVLALVKQTERTSDRARSDATFTEEHEPFSQR